MQEVQCGACRHVFEVADPGPEPFPCPDCGRKLRITPEVVSPETTSDSLQSPSEQAAASSGSLMPVEAAGGQIATGTKGWMVKDKQGREFGPIAREDLEQLAAARTLTCGCRVRRQTSPVWLWAMEVFPELADDAYAESDSGAAPADADPSPEVENDLEEPYEDETFDPHVRRRHRSRMLSHRGPSILMLGLMGFLCGLFGIAAAVLGAQDIRTMRDGDMDPLGYELTVSGIIAGVVGVVVQCGLVAYFWATRL